MQLPLGYAMATTHEVDAALQAIRSIPGSGIKMVTWTTRSEAQGIKCGKYMVEGGTGRLHLTSKAKLARAWGGSQVVSLLVRHATGRTHAATHKPTYVVHGYVLYDGRVDKLEPEVTQACYNTDNATGAPLPEVAEVEFA